MILLFLPFLFFSVLLVSLCWLRCCHFQMFFLMLISVYDVLPGMFLFVCLVGCLFFFGRLSVFKFWPVVSYSFQLSALGLRGSGDSAGQMRQGSFLGPQGPLVLPLVGPCVQQSTRISSPCPPFPYPFSPPSVLSPLVTPVTLVSPPPSSW